MQGAKRVAAARGELPLPVGLVYGIDGQIVLDADEQVRQAVAGRRTGGGCRQHRARPLRSEPARPRRVRLAYRIYAVDHG
ncbi:hypothetical protein GCM10010112_90430 [Actinoplanes lobatus]|uniref:Uncharacterized protein n=1 Tax=Actinoplanes lobatus TaxID=113568 RepID=A0ABQ4AXP2_9ACTN|nr:hypothetical protein GCM10010112_90430 [Actinoplanes lobatus]GIE45801.1 hypothetical protein Alo02nite_86990 [Actinoplanes lobatus]